VSTHDETPLGSPTRQRGEQQDPPHQTRESASSQRPGTGSQQRTEAARGTLPNGEGGRDDAHRTTDCGAPGTTQPVDGEPPEDCALSSRKWMSVDQAARILNRTRYALWAALERRALRGEKRGRFWCIPTIEVLRIFYASPGKRCHLWSCEIVPKKFKILSSSTRHSRDLKPYTCEDLVREFSDADTGEQLDPREAVLQLQDHFRSIARQLERRNISLHDDIVQEMSRAVLQETRKANAQWSLLRRVRGEKFPEARALPRRNQALRLRSTRR